ncbi:hypothetical protein [Egicoccus halophilus]|uniref:Uncharacterized protein n=1 Tax=Egicoccus halophilus TaxID=1670830 RepID=A0A8J3EVN8_9ACTN|nr:hypothetical protein [Egicoccus halophilus]GGI08526.1 hypothetical protein GCM10011354_29520 [Egicoccus halophilus]
MSDGSESLQGVQFPTVDGRRSTSATGREVFAAAARAVDPALAERIASGGAWHTSYVDRLRDLVSADLRSTGADLDAVPRAGLAAVADTFAYHRDGQVVSLAEAASVPTAPLPTTAVVPGRRPPARRLVVPYRGRQLEGPTLRRQLGAWVDTDVIEPTVAAAVERVLDEPDWLDLSDLTVLVLGAAAEMGPLAHLLRWGATVIPVDLPRPRLWERVLSAVREGAGRALVPVRHPVDPDDHAALAVAAGMDLDRELPELAAWLTTLDAPDVIGTYVYADGADNVRVSLAADVLTTRVLERAPRATLAGLLTPTDVYAAPADAVAAAEARRAAAGAPPRLARTVTRGRGYRPAYAGTVASASGTAFGLADAQVPQQGPNYALAKRLARWRLRVARAAGTPVSANVAPATATRSVTSNRLLAAAYAGAHHFGVEVFAPATSTALMSALLVRDLRDPRAAGRPDVSLAHPLALFADTAAHGGLWRLPWAPRSVLPLAAVAGLPAAVRGR